MTKFDSLLADLCEGNNITNPAQAGAPAPGQPTTTAQQPATATTTQQKPAAPATTVKPPTTNTTNTATKPNYDQLMKDFNDPTKKIINLTDLKKYGISVS